MMIWCFGAFFTYAVIVFTSVRLVKKTVAFKVIIFLELNFHIINLAYKKNLNILFFYSIVHIL